MSEIFSNMLSQEFSRFMKEIFSGLFKMPQGTSRKNNDSKSPIQKLKWIKIKKLIGKIFFGGQIRDLWIFLVGFFLDHICFWIFVWKIGEGIGEGAMGYKSSFYYRWFTKIGHIFLPLYFWLGFLYRNFPNLSRNFLAN